MACLCYFTSLKPERCISLQRSTPIWLGRADLPSDYPGVLHVSRKQCEVQLLDANPPETCSRARVLKVGQNSTYILRRNEHKLLAQGSSTEIEDGDSICLLSTALGHQYKLLSSPPEGFTVSGSSEAELGVASEAFMSEGWLGTNRAETCLLPHPVASMPAEPNGVKCPPVMLLLIGAPGSGKSTFSKKLQAGSFWLRVNQDTVSEGRRGKRWQCVHEARRILKSGKSAVIDRCHIDARQRADFLALAKELNVPAHAVVFNLDPSLVASQAAARIAHEGGVEGPSAKRISFSMSAQLKKNGLPTRAEGFRSIIVCENHKDIASAVAVWAAPVTTQTPEEAFLTLGGGRGKLQRFFAGPRAAAAPKAASPAANLRPADLGKVLAAASQDQGLRTVSAGGSPGKQPQLQSTHIAPDATADTSRMGGDINGDRPAESGSQASEHIAKKPRLEGQSGAPGARRDAFAVMMTARQKSSTVSNPASQGRPHGDAFGSWSDELRKVALRPHMHKDEHEGMKVYEDCIVIYDRWPKARRHGLVVARDPALDGPADLTAAHLPLLCAMRGIARRAFDDTVRECLQEKATEWAREQQAQDAGLAVFSFGFHAIPSMRQLHLHVISQDFDSPHLKNKKHWNSFTSPFFLELDDVISTLEREGRLTIDRAAATTLLKGDLHCHQCRAACKNMPQLKAHIACCQDTVALPCNRSMTMTHEEESS